MSKNNHISTQGVIPNDLSLSNSSNHNNNNTNTTSIPMSDARSMSLLPSTTVNTNNDASNSTSVGRMTSSGIEIIDSNALPYNVDNNDINDNDNPVITTVPTTGTTTLPTTTITGANDNGDKGNQGKKWTSDEDSIVIREYALDSSKYYISAVQYLNGRSQRAVKDRWMKYLSKEHDPSFASTVVNKTRWSAEEDATIVAQWSLDSINFADECEKLLTNRSKTSIKNRWNKALKKIHAPTVETNDTTVDARYPKAHNRFTQDEDNIIIAEWHKDRSRYATETHKLIPNRTIKSIIHRWNDYLRKNYDSTPVESKNIWTSEEDAIIVREREKDRSRYATEALKFLPNRTVPAIQSRWSNHLKRTHGGDEPITKFKWSRQEDDILVSEWKKDKDNFITNSEALLPGRSLSGIENRWKKTLKKLNDPSYKPKGLGNTTTSTSGSSSSSIPLAVLTQSIAATTTTTVPVTTTNTNINTIKISSATPTTTTTTTISSPVPPKQRWTADEDKVILEERERDKRNYAVEAHRRLPERSINAITHRWYDTLKKQLENENKNSSSSSNNNIGVTIPLATTTTTIPMASKTINNNTTWTNDEDRVIVTAYESNKDTFIEESVKGLTGRDHASVHHRWLTCLHDQHTASKGSRKTSGRPKRKTTATVLANTTTTTTTKRGKK